VTSNVQDGYYFQLSKSHVAAHTGWQKEAISLLRAKGLQAFIGMPINTHIADGGSFATAKSIRKYPNTRDVMAPVLIGPFISQEAARRALTDFSSILRPMLKKDQQGGEIRRQYGSGDFYTLGMFLIDLYKVEH
jgi:hypothetical protein